MSTDAEQVRIRRHGLRIALAVAVGFVWAGLAGQIVPFLGPMFAIQLLAAPGRLRIGPGIGLVVVISGGSTVMLALTEILVDRPLVLLTFLGLIYFICFFLQAQGRAGGVTFLVLVTAIIVPMFGVLQTDLGQSIVLIMLDGVVTALILVLLMHALFPEPDDAPVAPPASPMQVHDVVRRAAANTAILLAMMVWCMTNSAFSSAAVVPITVASLLGQLDLVRRPMAVAGLMLVNLFGGVVASVAFTVYDIRPSAIALFMVVLIVALLFAGKAVADRAKAPMYLGALSIFCILFGLGVSPLPGTAAESFSTRVGFVLVAIVYTVTLAAILWRPKGPATAPVIREPAGGNAA